MIKNDVAEANLMQISQCIKSDLNHVDSEKKVHCKNENTEC